MADGKVKKPIYKRVWFIVLVVLIVLGVAGSLFGGGKGATTAPKTGEKDQPAAEITYTPYNASTLLGDLKANALKASETYKGQNVEVTGQLTNIDSSGKYISIGSETGDFDFAHIQCFIKKDEQKSVISQISKGDKVVIKGKIKDVGEVMGYSMDIDEVAKASN